MAGASALLAAHLAEGRVTAADCRTTDALKVLFVGNSITLHGPREEIGWTNSWGMAASAAEKDYVHLVTRALERRLDRTADLKVRNLADFEMEFRTWDFRKADDLAKFRPDVLVVALGENVPPLDAEADRLAFQAAFSNLLGIFLGGRDPKPRTVVRGTFWPNAAKDRAMRDAACDAGVPFVKADLMPLKGMDASDTAFRHAGVRAHPGDRGMAAIAERVLQGLLPEDGIFLADPSLVAANGRFYLIGTESPAVVPPGAKLSGKSVFPEYVSDDLANWKLADTPLGEGRLLSKAEAIGAGCFWAPQLFARDGRWYFAYTSDFHWGLAVGDRPEGPFRRYAEFPKGKGRIDPFVLQDDDGRLYAYFSSWGLHGIVGVELTNDMKAFAGEPVRCVANDRPWERRELEPCFARLNDLFGYKGHDAFQSSTGVVEGPTVLKRNGRYVLFYSANDYRSPDYCVCAAVADAPLGPWKKLQEGAVLSREQTGLNGTGHGDAFVGADGRLWYVFHAHHSSLRIHPRRTGVIRLVETIGPDGCPRYAADPSSLRVF